jgi:hypothetical protein
MITTFRPDRSAELAPEADFGAVAEAQGRVGAEVALPPISPAAQFEVPAPIPCTQCGGSGILRIGDQQFRTCLECLGQGQLSRTVQQELLFSSLDLRVSAARAG